MCEPITIGTALAVGSFALQAGGSIANKKAQDRAYKENEKAARKEQRMAHYDASLRQQEEMTAARRAIEEGQRQGRAGRAAATVAAAEAGVGGMSVDMLLGDMERDEAVYTQSIEDQTVVTLEQLQRIKQGANAQAENRINSQQRGSWLTTGLQIAGAGVDLYANLRIRRPPTPADINSTPPSDASQQGVPLNNGLNRPLYG